MTNANLFLKNNEITQFVGMNEVEDNRVGVFVHIFFHIGLFTKQLVATDFVGENSLKMRRIFNSESGLSMCI